MEILVHLAIRGLEIYVLGFSEYPETILFVTDISLFASLVNSGHKFKMYCGCKKLHSLS